MPPGDKLLNFISSKTNSSSFSGSGCLSKSGHFRMFPGVNLSTFLTVRFLNINVMQPEAIISSLVNMLKTLEKYSVTGVLNLHIFAIECGKE